MLLTQFERKSSFDKRRAEHSSNGCLELNLTSFALITREAVDAIVTKLRSCLFRRFRLSRGISFPREREGGGTIIKSKLAREREGQDGSGRRDTPRVEFQTIPGGGKGEEGRKGTRGVLEFVARKRRLVINSHVLERVWLSFRPYPRTVSPTPSRVSSTSSSVGAISRAKKLSNYAIESLRGTTQWIHQRSLFCLNSI